MVVVEVCGGWWMMVVVEVWWMVVVVWCGVVDVVVEGGGCDSLRRRDDVPSCSPLASALRVPHLASSPRVVPSRRPLTFSRPRGWWLRCVVVVWCG